MISETIPALKDLTDEQKLILVGELWDELAARPNALPVRQEHLKILEERLAHYREHPESASAWEDVKLRILASR